MDPLEALPAEIVLRILDFAPISTVARLTRTSKPWRDFIDGVHQDTVYSSPQKTWHPPGSHDLDFLGDSKSFARYFDGTASWKDLCKRQTLLSRAWNSKQPVTRESVMQVGNDAIWRFRADFKRRFFLSTSQQGGLNVTDMDTGSSIWRLSNQQVRHFAHLEYQDGVAVWDREGNAVEVWKTDQEGLRRGEFRRTAILPHDCETRGFQLSYDTLCVISTEGRGFVYDMTQHPPHLQTKLDIEHGAIGHLDQDATAVLVSLGKQGYNAHLKASGERLAVLDPSKCKVRHHIHHPSQPENSIVSTGNAFDSLPSVEVFPPRQPSKERLATLEIDNGPILRLENETYINLEDDDWGAGMLSGDLMVGISRGGRVFVCPEWKKAIGNPKIFESNAYLIECESDGSSFDLGGWLSIRDQRIMFEIQDRVYVLALDEDGKLQTSENPSARPSFAFNTSSATQLAVPVSFMALFDDCIATTYTTLGWRRRTAAPEPGEGPNANRFRIFPTKTIRILSLAPSLAAGKEELVSGGGDAAFASPPDDDTHASILEIMDMMSEEDNDDNEDMDVDADDGSGNEGVW